MCGIKWIKRENVNVKYGQYWDAFSGEQRIGHVDYVEGTVEYMSYTMGIDFKPCSSIEQGKHELEKAWIKWIDERGLMFKPL